MNKSLLLFLFVFLGTYTFSQTKTSYSITKKGEVNVKRSLASDLKVKLTNLEPPSPDGNSTKSY
ncbi:MAG: hypothetical protein ACI8RY_001970, partial [Urechidicola sp.]